MNKRLHIIFLLALPLVSLGQTTFGGSTTFTLGSRTSFYTGSDATFDGTLTIGDSSATIGGNADFVGVLITNGTIVGGGDLNFFTNQNVGSLKFIGTGDQTITGDTLFVENLEVDKTGTVIVQTDQVFVSGSLDVMDGIVQTDDIDDLIVTGESSEDGNGYVEGKLVGLSTGDPVSFPMGINGFRNSITFSGTRSGVRLVVDVVIPEPETLIPTEEMVGIADEVEWQVRTLEDSTEATMTANFSGIDLVNFSNGQNIRADQYAPALVMIQKGDTIYTALNSSEATPANGASANTTGRIVSTTTVMIDTAITRINVAWLPFVDGPEFFVPNVFSPDGFYEENRVFRPFFAGGEVTNVTMAVYNAYNSEVYRYSESGADLDLSLIGWDGRLGGGQPAEEGVYYYTIQLVADGQVYQQTSSVLLVK